MKLNLYTFILVFSFSLSAYGQEIIDLSDSRELFVDTYLIDQLNGVELKLHHPHNEGPVLNFDKPWEGMFSGYCTIIKNGNKYQAYYRGLPGLKKSKATVDEVTCYAESNDGIHWKKPDLGIYEINGSRKNNVILKGEASITHNFSPFLDKNPKSKPDQKYKAVGGTGDDGLFILTSSDGIHWKKIQEESVIKKGRFDSQNVAFWSESEKMYVCYFRTLAKQNGKSFRSVSRTTSKDFIHWTEPKAMTFGDIPLDHLYTQQTSPYFRAPHIYLAIGARFMPNRQVISEEQAKELHVDPNYFKDCSDAILMSSRGGYRYDRVFLESFIRPGIGLDNWVSRSNYPALNVVQTSPEEMSIYVNEDYAQPTAHMKRYSLRLDGFTSLHALFDGGEIITKPFTFSGDELEINYSTSAPGEIRIEIQDESGKPIPGYALEDSETIIGNEISRVVSWKGNTDLRSLSSKIIRLRIFMKDSDLYSLKFN